MRRYALVTSDMGKAPNLDTVRSYLPTNYRASVLANDTILVSGIDNAGWTLTGYVLPRLASGWIVAKEISEPEASEVVQTKPGMITAEEDGKWIS